MGFREKKDCSRLFPFHPGSWDIYDCVLLQDDLAPSALSLSGGACISPSAMKSVVRGGHALEGGI